MTLKGRVYDNLPCPVCHRPLRPVLMGWDGLPQIVFHSQRKRPDCRLIIFAPESPGRSPQVVEIPHSIEAGTYARQFVREDDE